MLRGSTHPSVSFAGSCFFSWLPPYAPEISSTNRLINRTRYAPEAMTETKD